MTRRLYLLSHASIAAILIALAVLALQGSVSLAAQTPRAFMPGLQPMMRGLQDGLILTGPTAATDVVTPEVRLPPVHRAAPEGLPLSARASLAALAAAARLTLAPVPATSARFSSPAAPRARRPWPGATATGARPSARRAPLPAPIFAAPAALAPAPLAAVSEPVTLRLRARHSLLVDSPDVMTRVAVADDSVAQAIVVSPHQVLLQGKSPGQVSLMIWNGDDAPHAYTVDVALDPMPLQRELLRLYPQRLLTVTASGNALTVSGTLTNPAQAKQVLAVAANYAPRVVSDLSVDPPADPGQVLLQVRFAEVDRGAISQLGANLLSAAPGLVGSLSTGQFSPPSGVTAPPASSAPINSVTGKAATFALNDLLNVFLFNSNANVGLLIKALEQQNLLQILAEPNLIAMDGKQASFLAGGEFPFPVVQSQGAYNNVTIQFKPFGVNLHFKPTILPDGTIDLQVAPEVSALDFSNALTISGFQIPALSTRRADTELELRDGQSFVIAGLMDNRLTDNVSKIPGLSAIPILGKFFESRSTNRSRTELMVVVTAHLAKPSSTAARGPVMPKPFLNSDQFDGKGAAK